LTPTRISSFIPNRTQYVVPPGASGWLTIGYEDDDYSDNGYDNHDDGTEDQCKDCGDAWILVTVTHPYPYQNHFNNSRWIPAGTTERDYLVPDNPAYPAMSQGSRNSTEAPPTLEPEGVTFETKSKGVGPDFGAASRTVYLVSNVLAAAGFLRAELEFDMPYVAPGPTAPDPRWVEPAPNVVWGVALNFKNGDATDRDSDTKMGATCQFLDQGNTVKFHFTEAAEIVDLSGLPAVGYAAFESQQTVFKLVVQICRDDNNVTASYAELQIDGSIVNRGVLTTHPVPLPGIPDSDRLQVPTLAETLANPSLLSAAGFAIASKDGYQASVRFRSFTLQYQYGPCVGENPTKLNQAMVVYRGN
jgi:hypothetical protein